LHVHFYLATVLQGRNGDIGCYITSAEWMDVNYGSLVRQLLLDGLGGQALHVLDPKSAPFADAATTGAITCFQLGSKPTSMKVRRVEKVADLGALEGGRKVARDRLADAPRWSLLLRPGKPVPAGYVELGELCRVHRGTVTGANDIWVTNGGSHPTLPACVLTPSITKARELFAAGDAIASAAALRRVVDLPANLDELVDTDRDAVDQFLVWAKKVGGAAGYIARHRKAWWSVGMRAPAPILATYMARRPPAFVRNLAEARHINVAHGLYPRQRMSSDALDQLASSLRTVVTMGQGRTYAGGLTKFEPREMERIPVPVPAM
jgi:adenine-specific DNA-methyltransferase